MVDCASVFDSQWPCHVHRGLDISCIRQGLNAKLDLTPYLFRELATSGMRLSKQAIRQFALQQGVAPGIVVGQLQHTGYLPHTHCNDLKCTFVWANTKGNTPAP